MISFMSAPFSVCNLKPYTLYKPLIIKILYYYMYAFSYFNYRTKLNDIFNFIALIIRKDNPRLQLVFEEFDETAAFCPLDLVFLIALKKICHLST